MAWGGKGSLGEVGRRWGGGRKAAEITDIATKTSLSTEKGEVRRWGRLGAYSPGKSLWIENRHMNPTDGQTQ